MTNPTKAPRLTWFTKITYAAGGSANNIKQRGLTAFLLIFYNQVLGLPASQVALAVLLGTIFDIVIDPLIGQFSDNFNSRWGRRHPLIYVSAIPVSVAYMALWLASPHWPHGVMFAYLVGTLLVVRFFDTLFELPSSALLPEMTSNYDERTTIVSLRLMFGIAGGLIMTILAYRVFLRENANGSGGVLAVAGYSHYGIACAVVILVVILLSAFGTQSRIPYLSRPKARKISFGKMLKEMGANLKNASFVALLCAGMLMSIAAGARAALDLYFNLYFWGLTQTTLAFLAGAAIPGTIVGAIAAPLLARKFGKRPVAMWAMLLGLAGNAGPVLARFCGLMPPNGSKLLPWILATDVIITVCLAAVVNVMVTSMLNDVVEDVQVKTGRRAEGLLLAGDNLSKKLVSGLGVFISGMVLTFIAFPTHAERNTVPHGIVDKLAYAYVPIALCYVVAALALLFYRISRETHEGNLARLQEGA